MGCWFCGCWRCWRVTWPRKNENERFKDANEVLMFMGPTVLRPEGTY
ncbi:putative DNA helicase [Helianthus annuus]|nr:putative DNA helicase [Helianthus annuus]